MTSIAARIALVLLPFMAVMAADAQAQRREREDGFTDGRELSERELSETVRWRRTGGEVLSAERVPFDGRSVMHRVKVLDSSGRVRVYMDDPRPRRRPEPPAPARTRDDDD